MKIHSDDAFAPVAYLKVKRFHLEEKPHLESMVLSDIWELPEVLSMPISIATEAFLKEEFTDNAAIEFSAPFTKYGEFVIFSTVYVDKPTDETQSWTVQQETEACMKKLEGLFLLTQMLLGFLLEASLSWSHVARMCLYINNMDEFAIVNKVYSGFFGINPPARCGSYSLIS